MQQYDLDSLSALSAIRKQKFSLTSAHNTELKQLRRRQLPKTVNRFNDQNNSSVRASRFLVHFFDVHCTTTT